MSIRLMCHFFAVVLVDAEIAHAEKNHRHYVEDAGNPDEYQFVGGVYVCVYIEREVVGVCQRSQQCRQ